MQYLYFVEIELDHHLRDHHDRQLGKGIIQGKDQYQGRGHYPETDHGQVIVCQ